MEIVLEGSGAPPPAVFSAWRDPQPEHLGRVARCWAVFCGSRACLCFPRPPRLSRCSGTRCLVTLLNPDERRFRRAYSQEWASELEGEGGLCWGISGHEVNLEEMEEGIPTARILGRVSGSGPGLGVSEPGLGGVSPTCL